MNFLCNGGLELIMGTIALVIVLARTAYAERHEKTTIKN